MESTTTNSATATDDTIILSNEMIDYEYTQSFEDHYNYTYNQNNDIDFSKKSCPSSTYNQQQDTNQLEANDQNSSHILDFSDVMSVLNVNISDFLINSFNENQIQDNLFYSTNYNEDTLEMMPTKYKTLTIEMKSQCKQIKKGGRRPKPNGTNQSINDNTTIGHTKHSNDNIRRKIKVQFMHFAIRFFNWNIKKKCNGQQKNKFRTFDNKNTKDITVTANREMSKECMREYLSQSVSSKFKCSPNQNETSVKALIKMITECKNDADNEINLKLSNYLNMTVRDFYYKVFLNEDYDKVKKVDEVNKKTAMPGYFYEFCEKQLDREYGERMREIGNNFFEYFENTTARNRISKKYQL